MAVKRASSSKPKSPKAPKVSKAEKEAQKEELARLKNSREYPELSGMLATAPFKTIATLEWLNEHLPQGEPTLEKLLKKDKERFILATIRSGNSQSVINDLKDAPARKWKEFMVGLTSLSEKKAEEKIKALKPKEFTALLETYHIEPVRAGAKQAVSKPKTIPRVLAKLTDVREHLKL